jgi:hypothetical protein
VQSLAPNFRANLLIPIISFSFLCAGACSDKYLRFWDLETHHILCSCLYYHVPDPPASEANAAPPASHSDPVLGSKHHRRHHHHQHHGAHKKVPHLHNLPPSHAGSKTVAADEVLRIVKVSDCEDLLIGTYTMHSRILLSFVCHKY